MTNRNKAAGDKFERDVRDHCIASGVAAKRTRAGYERDYGDIHLEPGVAAPLAILQCKNERRVDLAGYVRDTEAQRLEAGAEHAAAVVKRRGVAAPGEQYVLLTLDAYIKLMKAVTEAARQVTPSEAPAQRVAHLRAMRRPDGGDAA